MMESVYLGTTRSESHIAGGYVLAIDGQTGEVLWHFNTVPQDESDQGWEIAGPTWVGGERNGGGIWETPSIDSELGLVYFAVGNPYGNSANRDGMNLFTDSLIALDLKTGKLEWYYQQVHHDVWDYDSGNQPVLFDMDVDGQSVKALAQASKNGWLYILDRVTGEPVHPIPEVAVSTQTATEGEEPWPTQPIPNKANGERMEPVSPVFPIDIPPEQMEQYTLVEQFTPLGPDQIFAPGFLGEDRIMRPLRIVLIPAFFMLRRLTRRFGLAATRWAIFLLMIRRPVSSSGDKFLRGYGQAGAVVNAGGVVFVGAGSNTAGYFYAFDALTGEELWKFNTGAGVFSSPAIYVIDGQEYVTVASGGGSRGRRGWRFDFKRLHCRRVR